MIKWFVRLWEQYKLRKAVRWTERYVRPDTLERWTPPQEQGQLSCDDIRTAMRKARGDTSPVLRERDGFDGLTQNEKAAWIVAYDNWVAGRGPTDEELLSMAPGDFQKFIEAKRRGAFAPVPWTDVPVHKIDPGLIKPSEWLEANPDQGLIVGLGINLRRLGEAYQRMEAGAELTPYDREIIAMRPDLNLGLINRQLRAIGKPEIRATSPDPKEIDS